MAHPGDLDPVATQDIVIPGPWVFEPRVAQVTVGDEVTWTNQGGAAHTVTIEALGIDRHLDARESFAHTFTEPGTYEYTCKLHPPGMAGTVIVLAAEGSASPDATNSTVA